jgi:NMD protein affecting ribosome stability and mRNA decay
MSFHFKEMKCKECGEPPQTTLTHDGLCVGCIAYMFEDCV